MIDVAQDPISRRWGFRIIEEDSASAVSKYEVVQRVLCEDFSCNSPQEAFAYVEAIRKALDAKYYKIAKDGIICGYQIYDVNSKQVIFEESGWTDSNTITDHITKIAQFIKGDIKMAAVPRAVKMSLGTGTANTAVRSTYTDPNTGRIFDSGIQNNSVDIDRIREEARKDLEAEAADDKKMLG